MIHIHVARTVLATAAKRYGPGVMRAVQAYRAGSNISRKRSLSHQDKGDKIHSFKSGTVPTIREWWQ